MEVLSSTKRPSSIFTIKVIWLFVLISHQPYLVTCDSLDDDSLQNALEAIERRQRNLQLQENDYYGQPENIGYGFQKNFGFFENGPAREVGVVDPGKESELQNMLLSYLNNPRDEELEASYDKRRSNFRERSSNRLVGPKQAEEGYGTTGIEYLQALNNLWSKYKKTHSDDDSDLEDLTDEQVEEILRSLTADDDEYAPERLEPGDVAGLRYGRNRRNYRVFDNLTDRKKRPAFGEGLYGKRSIHAQDLAYEPPSNNDFLYSLKFVNPDMNREAVEVLRDGTYEVGDEKDRDVLRILSNALRHSKQEEKPYETGVWMQEPVYYPEETYIDDRRNEKKYNKHFFKQHNGLHVNRKRFPVKRSATDEKVANELKGIFGAEDTTTEPPKKSAKKITDTNKKITEVTNKKVGTKNSPQEDKKNSLDTKKKVEEMQKKPEDARKKVVRRAEPLTKEEIGALPKNDAITELFHVKKKSVDWSQYFGLDKRSPSAWFRNDIVKRTQNHLMKKRFQGDRANVGNVNFLDSSQYEPFDTRIFNSKRRFSYDVDSNIGRMEEKIGSMEEKIIDDAVKYTGAHTGGKNQDVSQVKSDVIHHLEAAYSLEKMKNALEDFKNSIKSDKHFDAEKQPVETSTAKLASETSGKTEKPETSSKAGTDSDKDKRVAVKKEGAGSDSLDFLNDPAVISQEDDGECPVLERVLHNCLRVEELAGPYAELLLPICTLQQICYVCGHELGFSRASSCDLMYLTEAQTLCQGDGECLMSARDSMLALRDLSEQDLVSTNGRHLSHGSCSDNPCIQRYFMTTPGAVVPLEFHN